MTMVNLTAMRQSPLLLKIKEIAKAAMPAEWSTAGSVFSSMRKARAPTAEEYVKSSVWLAALFLVGAISAALVFSYIAPANYDGLKELMAALLGLSAIIVGFVVTLMLFTGSLTDTSVLTLKQLQGHAVRTKYLLVSQATTLASGLLLGISSLCWLVAKATSAPELMLLIIFAVVGGLLMIMLVRTALLPIQIFELHSASLQDKILAKSLLLKAKYDPDP